MTFRGEEGYLNLCYYILNHGTYRAPEGDDARYEAFAQPIKFDLRGGTLPLFTSKRTWFRGLANEMLWFISGRQDTGPLKDQGVHIWDTWDRGDGYVGPLYGFQWRHWKVDPQTQDLYSGETEIDQLGQVLTTLEHKPEGRSHCVTAWRPDHLKAMGIKPCHVFLQFYRVGDEISLALYQRSCDMFLGVPFNVAQYSLLLHMVAHQLGCEAREFTWIGGDVHIYEDHVEAVQEQLERQTLPFPTLSFARQPNSIDGYTYDDLVLDGYQHQGRIRAPISAQGQPGFARVLE